MMKGGTAGVYLETSPFLLVLGGRALILTTFGALILLFSPRWVHSCLAVIACVLLSSLLPAKLFLTWALLFPLSPTRCPLLLTFRQ